MTGVSARGKSAAGGVRRRYWLVGIVVVIALAVAAFLMPDAALRQVAAWFDPARPGSGAAPVEPDAASPHHAQPPAREAGPMRSADGTAAPGAEGGPGPDPRADTPARAATEAPTGSDAARTAAEPEPSLDIVRVEPNGDSVIAGRTRPHAHVELMRNDKPLAQAQADAGGNFAIVAPPLPTGQSEISYRSVAPDGSETRGRESVAVVIADDRTTKPLVALSTPDKPTAVLSRPGASDPDTARAAPSSRMSALPTSPDPARSDPAAGGAAADKRPADKPTAGQPSAGPPPAAKEHAGQNAASGDRAAGDPVSKPAADKGPGKGPAAPPPPQIVSIDAQEGGRLDVSVTGAPGATLRLYLNDTMVASGTVGADGRLAFAIGRGVRPGSYQVRVDAVEAGSGKVAQRAQVAFDFPASQEQARRAERGPAERSLAERSLAERSPAERGPAERAPSERAADAALAREPARGAGERGDGVNRGALPGPARTPDRSALPDAPRRREIARSDAADAPGRTAMPPADGQAPPAPPRATATSQTFAPPQVAEPPRAAETALPASRAPEPGTTRGAGPPERAIQPPASAPQPDATVFVPEIATARITRGDNLWQISRRSYGSGLRYTVIFDANKDQIRNPDLIYPGQIFVLPGDERAGQGGAKRG